MTKLEEMKRRILFHDEWRYFPDPLRYERNNAVVLLGTPCRWQTRFPEASGETTDGWEGMYAANETDGFKWVCPVCQDEDEDGELHMSCRDDEGNYTTLHFEEFFTSSREREKNVFSLDDHRIRVEKEFEDESVAYVEALWGKETFAFNVAVRDLEKMRRGTEDDLALREPQTYYEKELLVRHVRALANDIARHFEVVDLVREEDDLLKERFPAPPKKA